MMALPANARIWIAAGVTDLRRGFTGLSALVETKLEQKPFSGQVFVFRGRRGDLIKVLWYDGDGLCLFAKRLERGRFVWPQATSGTVSLTRAQLSMLLEGIDWRRPERTWDPQLYARGSFAQLFSRREDRGSESSCDTPRMSVVALPDLNVLPAEALRALILVQHQQLLSRESEIAHLKLLIAKLQRMQFGRKSEKLAAADPTTGVAAGRAPSEPRGDQPSRESNGNPSYAYYCSSWETGAACAARASAARNRDARAEASEV